MIRLLLGSFYQKKGQRNHAEIVKKSVYYYDFIIGKTPVLMYRLNRKFKPIKCRTKHPIGQKKN